MNATVPIPPPLQDLRAGFMLGILLLLAPLVAAAAPAMVSLVADHTSDGPVQHGLNKLKLALHQRGVSISETNLLAVAGGDTVVVSGLAASNGEAARLLAELRLSPVKEPESLLIRKLNRDGRSVLLVTGHDARGLMYALLDVADRVGWAKSAEQPFSEVRDTEEKPFTSTRALSIYTFNRAYWESRFYDEVHWARYLDVLAQNRFNSLVVIFGYENGGFLAPCYPYFFDVPEFPGVRMVGITPEQQQRNLAALNRLIQMAHDRGVSFTVGIWDHIYRGGVQGGGIPGADDGTKKPVPGLVWGVTGENLVPYTKAALAEFLRQVPAVDAIQFRMHDESGLKNSEQEAFWRDVFQMMKEKAPKLRLDLRAKGLPDSVIQSALEVGVPFRITTKYWMEQMGLPFHPTHINPQNQFDRRHSYADMLRYPQRYQMHWRLWNGGTACVLLWADPDYARRFAESTHLYDGDGFEVNEPLCTKTEAQPHDAKHVRAWRQTDPLHLRFETVAESLGPCWVVECRHLTLVVVATGLNASEVVLGVCATRRACPVGNRGWYWRPAMRWQRCVHRRRTVVMRKFALACIDWQQTTSQIPGQTLHRHC